VKVLNRLLFRLASSRPLRVIKEDDRPYLERYYLGTLLGVRCYLHRFVGSDPDRGLHDHPWPWAASLVLSGDYDEHLNDRVRRVRRWNWLRGDTFHRVVLPPERREVWTLFVHRALNTKPWGFRDDRGVRVRNASGDNLREWWTVEPIGRLNPQRVPADR
jgi:hypothetical protein